MPKVVGSIPGPGDFFLNYRKVKWYQLFLPILSRLAIFFREMDFTIGFPMKDSIGNLKNCWAFLGFLPDIGKLVIASVLLHVFF